MGFARRVVRKSVRKATPRSVRRVVHPANTVRNAVLPRPVKQASRLVYTVTNPLGAAENHVIDAVLNPGRGKRGSTRSRSGVSYAGDFEEVVVSGSGVRAAEAVESEEQLAMLMAVERERFAPAQRVLVPEPAPVDPAPFRQEEWAKRHGEVRFWQRAQRRALIAEVDEFAQAQAEKSLARAQAKQKKQQHAADESWRALANGEPAALTAALVAAFADNPAEVIVVDAAQSDARLVLLLPGEDVMPEKRANVTPTGRLSSKAWTKSEFNEVYADLLGAHLLATIREAWAVGPSLEHLRVIGAREPRGSEAEVLFDVDVSRADGDWEHDGWGNVVLDRAELGLNLVGRASEVRGWPQSSWRTDTGDLLARLGLAGE